MSRSTIAIPYFAKTKDKTHFGHFRQDQVNREDNPSLSMSASEPVLSLVKNSVLIPSYVLEESEERERGVVGGFGTVDYDDFIEQLTLSK